MQITHNIDSNDIERIKQIYNKGNENSGDDINNIYNKRFKKEDYNLNIVSANTFFCDLYNKELIDVITKYIKIKPDEYIANIHYINYGVDDEAKPHVDTNASIRTYIIMLNDKFEGGEFYLQNKLVPFKMGDMIEFDANKLHSVKPIKNGNREVLVIWIKWNKKNKKSLV
jgi:hypothetical protein